MQTFRSAFPVDNSPASAKLNALQTHGPVKNGSMLIALRGSAIVERYSRTVSIVTATVGLSDSTRGGGTFTLASCQ